MKTTLKALVTLAIVSNAFCLDLGHLLGLRRDWRDLSNKPADPEIIEVVRWRQPVCVVPGPGVPPCIVALKKNQQEYERNSAKGIERNQPEEPKSLVAEEQKKIKKEIQSSFPGLGRDIDEDIAQWCYPYLTRSRGSKSQDQKKNDWNSDYEICDEIDWVRRTGRGQKLELENSSNKILSPQIVNSVDLVELEGSEISGRSNLGNTVTLKLESRTPEMKDNRVDRQGKYLLIGSAGKNAQPVQPPPAIYVTKVLNSPVTATLVANNCFPDIGVPLCDEYQETLTIYQEAVVPEPDRHDTINNAVQGFPDATFLQENHEQGSESSSEALVEEIVQENTESSDFWNDPNNPNFGAGAASDEAQKPSSLLEQAINHVLNKPGVVSAIPPNVIEAIANNPSVLEALANAGNAGETSGDTQINVSAIKPQVVATSENSEAVVPATTSRPGFISSLLDIQRPAILNNFWNPGFGLFNRSTTAKPEKVEKVNGTIGSPADGHFANGLLGHGQGHVIETIQNLIHKPATVNTNTKPEFQPVLVIEPPQKPGLFENLWNPTGGFGLFDRHTSTTEKPVISSTEEPNLFISEIDGLEEPQPKPTQAPGIFGGLFSNPSRPTATDSSGDSGHGIFDIASSIFPKPTNRPLIISRPGAKPLLVEKPIYVQEKPAQTAGLLNFFIPASNKPILNVDHEVIKEPVYVYQKPQTAAGLLSNVLSNVAASSRPTFFQGWAIFGNGQEAPAKKGAEPSEENPSTKSTFSPDPEEPQEVEEIGEIEENGGESTFTADEIPEATSVLQAPLETTSSATKIIPEENEKQIVHEISSTPADEIEAEETNEEKGVTENGSSSADIADQIKAEEIAVGPEAILEDSEKNITKNLSKESENLGEESIIDNEA